MQRVEFGVDPSHSGNAPRGKVPWEFVLFDENPIEPQMWFRGVGASRASFLRGGRDEGRLP